MKPIMIFFFILLGLLLSAPAGAQMHNADQNAMPMKMMQDHMTSMATLMNDMAGIMQQGKLTPEQQARFSEFMRHMGRMMMDMAADPEQTGAMQRDAELKTVKEEWDYWKDEQRLYGH